jgi:hypothetical protein
MGNYGHANNLYPLFVVLTNYILIKRNIMNNLKLRVVQLILFFLFQFSFGFFSTYFFEEY